MSDRWSSSGVFISYRRQESSGLAGRLFDRLAARFGEDQVFMDVDRIELGVDFAEVISQEVSTCAVLLAVIGPHWLDAADAAGRRRLEDPDDIVRLEIQAALDRDIRVIPILVDGATMPSPQQLPQSLAKLVRRNALSVGYESFHADVDRLVAAINRLLAPPWSDALSTTVELTELQAADCESAGSLRSTSGTTKSQIEITNQSSRPVEIFWLDYDGNAMSYGTLQPQECQELMTYLTHPWLVTDERGTCISVFLPRLAPGRAVIRDQG